MSNDLVNKSATSTLVIRNMDDLARLGNMLASSGFFTDSRDAAQAGVKVLAGLEMGIGAFAAMSGIHVIKGKPSVGAGLMAAAIKRHPRYDYKIRRLDTTGCELEFFEDGESVGVSSFTEADAKAAGLLGNDNYKRNPRNMYFARSLSNGQRWYCPDVFGHSTYTPEELGATVDDDGNVIDIEPSPERPVAPARVALPTPVAEADTEVAPEAPRAQPEVAHEAPDADAEPLATDDQKQAILREMKAADVPPKTRMPFLRWLVDRPLKRVDDLTAQEATRFLAMVAGGLFEEKLAGYADHLSFSEEDAEAAA